MQARQGSVYSTRTAACRRDCGRPGEKQCPARRSGHTGWGFVVGIRRTGPKWQQLRRQGFATRREAEDALAAEIPDIRVGKARPLADRQITVADWADVWLAGKVKLKASSRESYRALLDTYIRPALGRVKLLELSPAHVDALLAAVRDPEGLRPERNHRGEDGTLSARTIVHIHACLHAMIRTAVKRNMIPDDPCQGVELETPDDHQARVWEPEEAVAFLTYAEEHEPRYAIACRLALRFGLRRSEIVALRWEDIGEDIHIHRAAVQVGKEIVPGKPKSRAGDRRIPLEADPGMAAALRAHRKRQLADRLAAGERWEETGLLVTEADGRQVAPWRLTARWKSLIEEAGLPVVTLHEGRHTANSLWRSAGIDSTLRMAWGGWSTQAMADRTYNHVRPAEHTAAAAKIAAFWTAHSGSM